MKLKSLFQNKSFKKFWDTFIMLLALVFIFVYAFPVISDSESDTFKEISFQIQILCWLIFALDLIIGLALAQNRFEFLKKHPIEVLSVIVPFLRPLRLLRLLTVVSIFNQKFVFNKRINIGLKVAITTLFLAFIAAIEITSIESLAPNSNIKTFSDGLWWAATTVTTVGYGDRYPVTNEGRFLAFGLMICGIALLAVVSANLAAWFIEIMQKEKSK
jgi:voltage-gated potassium channel